MKIEEIRKMARNTGIASYFKSLYQHSTQVFESLSEDQIKDIFRTRIDDGTYGQACTIWFGNSYRDDTKNIVMINVDVMYANDGLAECESISLESSFDYQGLWMAFHFDDKAETITFETFFQHSNENKDFLRSLTDSDYLKTIFGKDLVENLGKYSEKLHDTNTVHFSVSIKWFEE